MAGGDTLASLGDKVTEVFVGAFASGNPNVSLVFLPFALPTPDDIMQGGVVNPTRMASFLLPNFDAPYLMSASQYTVHGKDLYYGSASQIYALAASSAQPTASVGSDAWKRINAEIAMAQSLLNPAGVTPGMTCVPDDWVSPDNASYWSTFDSTQSQAGQSTSGAGSTAPGNSGAGAPTPRVFSPALWTIKPAAAQATPVDSLVYLHAAAPAAASPLVAHPVMAAPSVALSATAKQPVQPDPRELPIRAILREPGISTVSPPTPIYRLPFPRVGPAPAPSPPPPPPPPPSSSMSVHFEYMSATIGFTAAGISIWNGVFLADPNWCVPGMTKGGLLPTPDADAAPEQGPLAYGLPIAIIVVKNLNISVKWAGQDQASLGDSGGFLGPFSLAGASATNAPDGSWTYSRPGMQVVALLCSQLPVLPPKDSPDVAGAATASGASSAPTAATNPSPST